MLDHILGRPSTSWRKTQVLATALFWVVYMRTTDANGPPLIRRFSKRIARLMTPWQIILVVLNVSYVIRHFDAVVGLAAPEPLAHMYSANFYRATWFVTALDAGYWTAMNIQPVWLREMFSVLFTVYYMLFAHQADEKVRKIRATITAQQLRNSWEKTGTPILGFLSSIGRPSIRIIRKFEIDRGEDLRPVSGWIYFDGTEEELKRQEKVVISFPGGGFVSMSPRHHDDAFCAWAKKLGAPLVSIDYKKAPEYSYPYALYECYDAYREIMLTKGACLGFGMSKIRKSALVGDSAGGNYVAAVTIMLLENRSTPQVPMPSGLVLIYPFLDFNITSWMSADHLRLLRQESQGDMLDSKRHHERRKSVLQVYPDERDREAQVRAMKLADLKKAVGGSLQMTTSRPGTRPTTPGEGSGPESWPGSPVTTSSAGTAGGSHRKRKPDMPRRQSSIGARAAQRPLGTRLAMTSRVSFFADRIISPDMMRAMALLYIGPNNKPDFHTDYLLSPILAPQDLLAKFPKTYFLCGEVDPFVDDTVILAGRIKEAKQAAAMRRRDLDIGRANGHGHGGRGDAGVDDCVEMTLIRGTSHGFLQMRSMLPEARNSIARCRTWLNRILDDGPAAVPSKAGRREYNSSAQVPEVGGGNAYSTKGFSIADSDDSDSTAESDGDALQQLDPASVHAHGRTVDELASSPANGGVAAAGAKTRVKSPQPKRRLSPAHDRDPTDKGTDSDDDPFRHQPWESKHVLDANELLNNRKQTLVRALQTGAKSS